MSAQNQAALANAHLTLELALLVGGLISGVVAVALIWLLSRSIVTPIVGTCPAPCRGSPPATTTLRFPPSTVATRSARWPRPSWSSRMPPSKSCALAGETEAMRASAEEQRRRAEADKAREAEEIAFAVDQAGNRPSALADGNVAYRITVGFADRLWTRCA